MKTERELFVLDILKDKAFLTMCKEKAITPEQMLMRDGGGFFKFLEVKIAWNLWLASAQREGYKLVPVEPTRKMEMAGMNAGAGFVSRSIYKAMLEAVEK